MNITLKALVGALLAFSAPVCASDSTEEEWDGHYLVLNNKNFEEMKEKYEYLFVNWHSTSW